jgi:AmmeMemoRadiSam system protein A
MAYLSETEKTHLLRIAREALELGVRGKVLPDLEFDSLPLNLAQPGASFVTLTKKHELRGCIGSLEASLPLAEDVRVHTIAAALEDYRFPPVLLEELSSISIEISILSTPKKIIANGPEEILSNIRPGIDGVIVKQGIRRATFLPQVWEKVPEINIFMGMLCRKMGAASDYWQSGNVEIYTYQVEHFEELI